MKTLHLSIIFVVASIAVIVGLATMQTTNQKQTNIGIMIESNESKPTVGTLSGEPLINHRFGDKIKVQNDFEASQLAGFYVKFPTKLPDGYKLQLSVVDPTIEDNKYVFLFYSTNAISDTQNVHDFWDVGGIIIIYHKANPDIKDKESFDSWLSSYIDSVKKSGYSDVHEITINGHSGMAYNNQTFQNVDGIAVNQPSQVEYIAGDTDITLQADLPSDVLISIGQSIFQ